MRHKHYNGEGAELADGPGRKERNDTKNRIIGAKLQRVGRSSVSETLRYTLLDRQGDRGFDYSVNLMRC